MAITTQISGGACGLKTVINASSADGMHVTLTIESDCPQITAMAAELTKLNAFEQVLRTPLPDTIPLRLSVEHKLHTTCLVPVGILKSVEAAAGLALPAESWIKVIKSE
ncbi:MAG: hypothetical protein JXA89_27775 [Anaerolineae bacterium]|nr:hypothetical protein [Anaerolineae bacterium]